MKTLILFSVCVASAQTPFLAAGNVAVPLDEFNRLTAPAARATEPFPFVLRSAEFAFAAKSGTALGQVTLKGTVLAAGLVKIPLPAGLVLIEARGATAVQRDGAYVSGPGEFEIAIDAAVALRVEPGRALFDLHVPAAGVARLALSVPGEQTQARLSAGIVTKQDSRGGSTHLEATLPPMETVTVSWAARAAPVAATEERVLSDVKSMIAIGENEVTVTSTISVTVALGAPSRFVVALPADFELTGVSGGAFDLRGTTLTLLTANASAREHRFQIKLAGASGAIALPSLTAAMRETGEVLIEASGAAEVSAAGAGGLRRMDVREASAGLAAQSNATRHAAFRYQRRAGEPPSVKLEWLRYPAARVAPAIALHASATTLVSTEGRTLTEVKMTIDNASQPFLKLALPAGTTVLSADVAGEKVKPVQGADGERIPLTRPGFKPAGAYEVSFVVLHAGTPFGKKGTAQVALPSMDVPVAIVDWELFLPENFKVTSFTGDAVSARLLPYQKPTIVGTMGAGMIGGVIIDASGAVIPHARVELYTIGARTPFRTVTTDMAGNWVAAGVPSGRVRVVLSSPGFKIATREIDHVSSRGSRVSVMLEVGSVTEAVEVNSSNAQVERAARQNASNQAAPANVIGLQRRVAGVLPIAIDVPRAGALYRFVRPLVVDEETRLSFVYRSR